VSSPEVFKYFFNYIVSTISPAPVGIRVLARGPSDLISVLAADSQRVMQTDRRIEWMALAVPSSACCCSRRCLPTLTGDSLSPVWASFVSHFLVRSVPGTYELTAASRSMIHQDEDYRGHLSCHLWCWCDSTTKS